MNYFDEYFKEEEISQTTMDNINSMFGELSAESKEDKVIPLPKAPGKPKLKLKEPMPLTLDEENFALKMANKEIKQLKEGLSGYEESIAGTMASSYIYDDLSNYAKGIEDMDTLINMKIDKDKLTESGNEDYKEMVRIRLRILNDMLGKYKK
mgnify:CR=1 FL=1